MLTYKANVLANSQVDEFKCVNTIPFYYSSSRLRLGRRNHFAAKPNLPFLPVAEQAELIMYFGYVASYDMIHYELPVRPTEQ